MRALAVWLAAAAFLACAPWPARAAEFRYDSGGRRDPMIPLDLAASAKLQSPVDFTIQGIIYDPQPGGSLVLIDGEFYKEGDRVKSSNIISILKDRIILQQNDEKKTLWLREEILGREAETKGEA